MAACADPSVGPLASFEGLLSMYGKNFSMFNDMIVAVEDLRNVEFSVVVVDRGLLKAKVFPVPRVTGSREATQ